jgi:DNA-binding Lrp family transcriptional regulator
MTETIDTQDRITVPPVEDATSDTTAGDFSRVILSTIQAGFPVATYPYEELAKSLGSTEREVFDEVERLVADGTIRRIGASFDSYRLGYKSTLVAMAVDPEDLDDVAELVSAYSGVTHNYERDNDYNLWFTLIESSWEAIDETIAEISRKTGYDDILNLPAMRIYKIRVDFDLDQGHVRPAMRPTVPIIPATIRPALLSAIDRHLVRVLQGDISGEHRPFSAIAHMAADTCGEHLSEEEVIRRINRWIDAGIIRRVGAIVRHEKLGYTANVMSVWNVPEKISIVVGAVLAAQPEVSHCYERPSAPTWPSNLYAMVHGHSKEECAEVVKRVQAQLAKADIELPEPLMLYTTREVKKTSAKYFME